MVKKGNTIPNRTPNKDGTRADSELDSELQHKIIFDIEKLQVDDPGAKLVISLRDEHRVPGIESSVRCEINRLKQKKTENPAACCQLCGQAVNHLLNGEKEEDLVLQDDLSDDKVSSQASNPPKLRNSKSARQGGVGSSGIAASFRNLKIGKQQTKMSGHMDDIDSLNPSKCFVVLSCRSLVLLNSCHCFALAEVIVCDKENPSQHFPFLIGEFSNDEDPDTRQLHNGCTISHFNADGGRLDAGHCLAGVSQDDGVLIRLPHVPSEIQDPRLFGECHERCEELNDRGTVVHREAHRVAESNAVDEVVFSGKGDFEGAQSVCFLTKFTNCGGVLSAKCCGEPNFDEEGELCLNAIGKIPKGKTDAVCHVNWKVHIHEERPRFGDRRAKPAKGNKKAHTAEAEEGMDRWNATVSSSQLF